jgi:hypothetical protein
MPLLAMVKVASLYQKSGFMTASSVSTAAYTTSNGTAIYLADKDNLSLLVRLQGRPIHAPPGLCPLRTSARAPTKTQMAADQKAERLIKKQAAEEKKLAIAACKVERESKKKEKLISAAKDKAAKVSAKAEELRLKLAEAINGGGSGAAAGQELVHHPQKKSRGSTSQSVGPWPCPILTCFHRGRERQSRRGSVCALPATSLTAVPILSCQAARPPTPSAPESLPLARTVTMTRKGPRPTAEFCGAIGCNLAGGINILSPHLWSRNAGTGSTAAPPARTLCIHHRTRATKHPLGAQGVARAQGAMMS